jgi:hypothetical protein
MAAGTDPLGIPGRHWHAGDMTTDTDGTVPDADRMTDGTMTDDGPVPAVKGKSTDTTVTRPAASVARVLGTPADAAEF